jgi:crossover junction endodeoxyribonuclease RuvC
MLKTNEKIILGVDPGLAETGYGLISDNPKQLKMIDYGCIYTESNQEFSKRLFEIHEKLKKVIKKYQPVYLAVEDLYFAKNVKSALKVGQALGAIVLTGSLVDLPVFYFTPLQIKQALAAYGRAEKSQIQKMVQVLLNLDEIPRPDHAADALAVAVCAAQTKKFHDLTK